MEVRVVTVATHECDGLAKLLESCAMFGVGIEVLGLGAPWKGFGTKVILLREWLRTVKNCSHFMFVDAYDVVFTRGLEDVVGIYEDHCEDDQVLFSTEKGCWPDESLAVRYALSESLWTYLNSGSFMGPVGTMLGILDRNPVNWTDDDQLFYTSIYLKCIEPIVLDRQCRIFQSLAFEAPGDFDYGPPFTNLRWNKTPAVLHGNGKTDMSRILI